LPAFQIGRRVERQQHGHRAASDAGKKFCGDGVELDKRRAGARIETRYASSFDEGQRSGNGRTRVDISLDLIERRAPVGVEHGHRGCPELVGAGAGNGGWKAAEARQNTSNDPDAPALQNQLPPGRCIDGFPVK